ncbi:MAG TPA: hypothetical protein PKW56_07310, partial [Clostridiales bacterium]|nr:hypothetical protein [Clostridiales bacterium]
PYCATPLIISSAHDETMIQPGSLLPFKINIKEAYAEFKKWARKLWFAPNDLKKSSLGTDMFKASISPTGHSTRTRRVHTPDRGATITT